jgi:Rieske Fe-S protein
MNPARRPPTPRPPRASSRLRAWVLVALVLLMAVVGLAGGRYLWPDAGPAVTLAPTTSYRPGDVVFSRGDRLVVVVDGTDDAKRFRALVAVDPRSGCSLVWLPADGLLHDPCLGSIYARDGTVLGGPSARSLTPLSVSVVGEHVVVRLPPRG